jgi:putative phosphoesterase
VRVGIVSDVHNNVAALEYAIEQLHECDVIASLGDLVSDYRVDPQILAIARDHRLLGIVGNHEKSILFNPGSTLRRTLAEADLDYLQTLPASRYLELDGHRIQLVHGSPWDDPADYRCIYVTEHDTRALARAAAGAADVVVLGHTHVPMAVRTDQTLIFNPGSCGEARGRNSHLTFGRLDTRAGLAEVFAIRPGLEPERLLRSEF